MKQIKRVDKRKLYKLLMSEKGTISIDKAIKYAQKKWPKNKKLNEDLEFARRTEAAWKQYDKGKFKRASSERFLNELKR